MGTDVPLGYCGCPMEGRLMGVPGIAFRCAPTTGTPEAFHDIVPEIV